MGYQLGIDLGSASTVVAVVDGGWPQVLALGGGADIPTVLYASPGGEIQVGRAAERRAATDPGRAVRGFPRRLGDPTPILLGEAAYTPEALVSRLLSWAIATATRMRKALPDHIAVACPTTWSDYRRDLLIDAVGQVDTDVSITVCSSADAVGALLSRRSGVTPGAFVGIYDLGAGSFEASVLAAMPDGFRLAGTSGGITHAGGADFDEIVLAHVLRVLGDVATGLDRANPETAAALRRQRQECAQAKEILSEEDMVDIPVDLPVDGLAGAPEFVRLTREEFEALIRPTVDDTVRVFERTLRSVPAIPADLSALLLLGGSARIPLVGRTLAEAFPDIERQEIGSPGDIALGAALIAAEGVRQIAPPLQTVIIAPPALSVPPALSMPPDLSVPRVPAGAGTAAVPVSAPDPVPVTPVEPPGAEGRTRRRALAGIVSTRRSIVAVAAAVVVLAVSTTAGVVAFAGGGSSSTSASIAVSAPAPGPSRTSTDAVAGPSVRTENIILASGSSEVSPITETAYSLFRQQQGGVSVRVESTSTDDGFTRLCRGEIDIAGASYAFNGGFKGDPGCADRIAEFEIAHNTVPVVVNPQNTWAQCLTLSQLTNIWKKGSTITNWNQIDPSFPNEPVAFFGPPPTSVHAQVFNHDVNGASDNVRGYQAVELEGVAQNVAQNRDALGFLDFPTFETYGNRIRGVALDNGIGCVPPSVVSAGTGTYLPLCKPLYLYVSKDALRKPATAAFVKFYLSHGQDIAFKAHSVPRNDETTANNVGLAGQLTNGVGPVRT
ncbi:Hsp70 family protein [Frankia sp. Cppng1_Ct_nod]|uniref:Hsp70 family protein n=1 Tax=Frankia sp. Cppng1_Ct_nod TaxID=2897162 RepID=UPI002024D36F|nr:Hsp70 family protein [Frankia sp. Cppng1_Ct_nod]